MSEDPIGFAAGDANLYRYVGNGVTGAVDPSGLAKNLYWYYFTRPDSWFHGIGSGANSVLEFLDPRTIPDDFRNAYQQFPEDWRRMKQLWNKPVEYCSNRVKVVGDGIQEQLSTPAGWGEVYVFAGTAAVAGKVPLARGHRVASGGRRVFTVQSDFPRIWSSGRVWGQTEGSVYGMRFPNAPWWRTLTTGPRRDPGVIVFQGNAAKLFSPHEVFGPFSGVKRLCGQYKAGFGDIVFDQAYRVDSQIFVHEAHIGPHLGQSSYWAFLRLWGRRGIDISLDAGIGEATTSSVGPWLPADE